LEGYINLNYLEEKTLKSYVREILADIFLDQNGEPRVGSRIAISSLVILARKEKIDKNEFKSIIRSLVNNFATRGIDYLNESLLNEINSLLYEKNNAIGFKFRIFERVFNGELKLEHRILDSMIEECNLLIEDLKL